ncbi:ornithine carbamoyltransferase [Bartonella fuyuanensis]|uniref:Ornithine carbamoyltransferase n=1 Tax=Bartonella fuyuanensis TaxID=1460968 RepID=A0A840E490_9HYPH|nr:ornithine carbamoyltransferase [Bartonella fuyuanensis]
MQLGHSELIADTVCILSRFVDIVILLTTTHQFILELTQDTQIPVINVLNR